MRTHALLSAAALALTALTVPAGLAGSTAAVAAAPATPKRAVAYTDWDRAAELGTGSHDHVRVARGALRLDLPERTRRYAGRTYDVGTWTTPWVSPGFTLTELIASWDARTPAGTFVEVQVRGRTADGRHSSWDVLGRWASDDTHVRRTSVGGQGDDLADVNVDTWTTAGLDAWQLRAVLLREAGTTRTPRLDALGAVATRLPSTTSVPTSRPRYAQGVVLPVPRYSQRTHSSHGGEGWCSPTSLAMVLGYYDALPGEAETAWVGSGHADRVVDHVADATYDHAYRGTGNWPFNTAYAATRTDQAFVTRFRSLVGVEKLVAAGIPVITSLAFGANQLDGAPLRSTPGHLVVVVGFTADGDVVVNDPYGATKQGVRRTYDRGQFETAWLKRGAAGGSGGVAYVVRDAAHPLPARGGTTSW